MKIVWGNSLAHLTFCCCWKPTPPAGEIPWSLFKHCVFCRRWHFPLGTYATPSLEKWGFTRVWRSAAGNYGFLAPQMERNTRKHSSRRCTACPPTIYTSVANHQMSALVRFGVPQMNNFEQLSRLGHQMSLAWNVGQDQGQGGGSLYRGEPRVRAIGGCFLYGEVQCIMGNGHMGPPPLQKQNDRVRHLWKYYLPTISLAGGKDGKQ